MLQLLRSKLLPVEPPTAIWYWSNSKLKEVESRLNVADTDSSGQPVPPSLGKPGIMPSTAKAGALSAIAANIKAFSSY